MTGPLRKVQQGEPVKLSASTWNTLIDSARWVQGQRASTARKPTAQMRSELVLVRNDSGGDRGRFDILGVAGPLITPTDNVNEFANRIALSGVIPTAAHAGRFVVLAEPIANGKIGKAWGHGVCQVRVAIADETHRTADIAAGESSTLASSASGSAVLLWVQPSEDRDAPGVAWAIAKLGGGAGTSFDAGASSIRGGKLAMLTHVQRYSADNSRLPAYVWREASIDVETGEATASEGGDGTHNIPRCAAFAPSEVYPDHAVLLSPRIVGQNLLRGVNEGGGFISFRITAAPDTTHTVLGYEISISDEYGAAPGVRRKLGYAEFGPADELKLDVTNIPMGEIGTSYIIIWVRTTTDSETVSNAYLLTFDLEGEPNYVVSVTEHALDDPAWPLSAPADGDTIDPDAVSDGETNLTVSWPAKDGATAYWIYVGTTPGAYDIHDSNEIDPADRSHVCPGVPCDGSVFYVQIWYDLSGNWTTFATNTYRCRIAQPDRRALIVEDFNAIALDMQGGLAGISEIPDGSEDEETELAVPILVHLFEVTDAAGQVWFLCNRIAQDIYGLITNEGPSSEADYTDNRYWVTLGKPKSTADDATAQVEIDAVTGDRARVITVTNLAEAVGATHALPVGTPVLVRAVRVPDKPWLTRYAMNVGGTGGGAVFLAKIQSQGPAAEADYPDARYWVQEVDDTTSTPTGILSLAVVPVANGGRWVTAHNLVERGIGGSGAGSHGIRKAVTGIAVPDRYVIVHEVPTTTGTKYVFSSYPGQMQEGLYAFKVSCLDGDCPVGAWYQMTGPSFTMKLDPGPCP